MVKMNPTTICQQALNSTDIESDLALMRSPSRKQHLVMMRKLCAMKLYEEGIAVGNIAMFLWKSHGTINHLINYCEWAFGYSAENFPTERTFLNRKKYVYKEPTPFQIAKKIVLHQTWLERYRKRLDKMIAEGKYDTNAALEYLNESVKQDLTGAMA